MHVRILLTAWLATLLAFVAIPAQAHPHVWVDYTASFETRGTQLVGVRQTWRFKRGFPVRMAVDGSIRIPRDGVLDPTATAAFRTQAFDSLKRTDYFTHVFVGGQPARFGAPADFVVSVDDNRIVYSFVLPLAAPVELSKADVVAGVWDPSFFVNFELPAPTSAAFAKGAPGACKAEPFRDDVHRIFGGAVSPMAIRLTC